MHFARAVETSPRVQALKERRASAARCSLSRAGLSLAATRRVVAVAPLSMLPVWPSILEKKRQRNALPASRFAGLLNCKALSDAPAGAPAFGYGSGRD